MRDSVKTEGIETLLEEFNHRPTVLNANRFFRFLADCGFLDETVEFGADAATDSLHQQVWYWAAEYLYDVSEYSLGLEYALKAEPLIRDAGDLADCKSLISLCHFRLGDYSEAAAYAHECYEADLAAGDIDRISSSLNTLCGIYLGAGRPAEAEEWVLKGLELVKKSGNTYREAILEGKASEIYHALGDDEEALRHARIAYEIDRREGREEKMAIRQSQMAAALKGLRRYNEARDYLQEAIGFLRRSGNSQSLGISLNELGDVLVAHGNNAEAIACYREAAGIFESIGNRPNEIHSRRGLYELLWKSDPDAAMVELDRFNELKDSLYSTASAQSLSMYNAQFGNDWLELENHAQKRARVLLSLLVLAVVLVSVAVWWIMRRRNRRQSAINERLSNDIRELREQYRQLNSNYDRVLQNSKVTQADATMSEADRKFLEQATMVTNALIGSGQVDVNSVASEMGMSLFQFRQRLAAATGETPQSFVQIIRIQRARHLLETHQELNITEIAHMCAYNDAPNFTRAFKRALGMTPSEYMQRTK